MLVSLEFCWLHVVKLTGYLGPILEQTTVQGHLYIRRGLKSNFVITKHIIHEIYYPTTVVTVLLNTHLLVKQAFYCTNN